MRWDGVKIWLAAGWSAFVFSSLGATLQDPCMSLGIPAWTNGQIQVQLNGEAGISYVLESSTDLQNWTPVLTNSDPLLSRTITFDAPGDSAFYRMRRWQLYLFEAAIAARQNINALGNTIMVDSFDSADPLHSTNGMYNPTTRKAGGNVASGQGAINVQNATIYGKVLTGPSGVVSTGPNGSVGDLSWPGPGIEAGWWVNNYRFCVPDVSPPFTAGFAVPPLSTSNTFWLGTGNYFVNGDFNLLSGQTLYVAGVTKLYVTGNFTMQSATASSITLAPAASLRLYVGTINGPAVTGTLTLVNVPGNEFAFQYYGLPSNTTVAWNGAGSLIGCICAPEASLTLGGGGSTAIDFQGACVVNSMAVNGHVNFHYDENLKRTGPIR